jgi:hypothetical protein
MAENSRRYTVAVVDLGKAPDWRRVGTEISYSWVDLHLLGIQSTAKRFTDTDPQPYF